MTKKLGNEEIKAIGGLIGIPLSKIMVIGETEGKIFSVTVIGVSSLTNQLGYIEAAKSMVQAQFIHNYANGLKEKANERNKASKSQS